MEKHVTSLEISKKLKELGVKQESEFVWADTRIDRISTGEDKYMQLSYIQTKHYRYKVSAFLASELGELLPNWVFIVKDESNSFYCYASAETYSEYHRNDQNSSVPWDVDEEEDLIGDIANTMSDAMGKMLIYLLENKLIKI